MTDKIRAQAWAEYQKRGPDGKNWTEGQQKAFMAGMCVMWRLCAAENPVRPLFTYGPDSKPKELRELQDDN